MSELRFDETIVERARHDHYLMSALMSARMQGLTEKEAYIATIHMLLDVKDEVVQERIEEAMTNTNPLAVADLMEASKG